MGWAAPQLDAVLRDDERGPIVPPGLVLVGKGVPHPWVQTATAKVKVPGVRRSHGGDEAFCGHITKVLDVPQKKSGHGVFGPSFHSQSCGLVAFHLVRTKGWTEP